jgi:hypothetical protein
MDARAAGGGAASLPGTARSSTVGSRDERGTRLALPGAKALPTPTQEILMENDTAFESNNGQARMIGERVAHSITGISDRVRESSETFANRLDDAAGYLRGRSGRDFAQDLGNLVRNHPWQVLGGIGIAYLALKILRR